MSKKSKQTTGPSKFAQPYVNKAAGVANQAYAENAARAADISGQLSGLLPSYFDKAQNNPMLDEAIGYNTDVLSGRYLEGNPQLESMIAQTGAGVTDKVNAAIGARGRTGGDAHSAILAKQLAENETGLRYKNYGDERAAMEAAVDNVGNLTSAQYAGLAPLLALAQGTMDIGSSASDDYIRQIAGLMGNYNTTTSKKSPWEYLAQAAGNAASAFASKG